MKGRVDKSMGIGAFMTEDLGCVFVYYEVIKREVNVRRMSVGVHRGSTLSPIH